MTKIPNYHDLIWGTKCGGFEKNPYFRSQIIKVAAIMSNINMSCNRF